MLEAFVVSFLRSFTEFVAVSSSGHSVLIRDLYGIAVSHTIDGAVRSGMIGSILAAFWPELWAMARSVGSAVRHPASAIVAFSADEHLRMAVYLLVGSIPLAAIGIPFSGDLLEVGEDTKMVSTFVIVSGLLLFLTRLVRRTSHRPLSIGISFLVGCAQALSIIPGLARMAAAMSMAVYAGVAPVSAARYSVLLALPALVGMLTIGSQKGTTWFPADAPLTELAVAFVGAMAAGWLGIHTLLWAMRTGAVRYLALYCLLIGLLGIIFV